MEAVQKAWCLSWIPSYLKQSILKVINQTEMESQNGGSIFLTRSADLGLARPVSIHLATESSSSCGLPR